MQDIDIEAMVDEIQFAECICFGDPIAMNPEMGIHFKRLFPILAKYIPNFQNYMEHGKPTNPTNNTPLMASTSTEAF